MYKGNSFLAIIPARSGSKGLPDKNIRSLCGKPLMAHTIDAALSTEVFDSIVVTTDSERYAVVARQFGAETPFLRPSVISGDTSLASEFILHTIEELRKFKREYDFFALLQPTSPLRKAEHILEGVKLIVDEELDSVVAFSKAEHPMSYYHQLPADLNLGNIHLTESNRQEHDTYYRVNGMLYIAKCEVYQTIRSFYGTKSKALIIDNKYAIDVDDENDFALAEYMLKGVFS